MALLYLGMEDTVVVVREGRSAWAVEERLSGQPVQGVAADPHDPARVYAATAAGLWRSTDGGRTWARAAASGLDDVTSVAVGLPPDGGPGPVYAGTEPSRLFRSDDGGITWRELHGLAALPSAPTWSFPPRPETHHVRWIAPDPARPGRLYVAIEAGALVHSADGGETWHDRVRGGPYDTHTLAVHPHAPDRLYSAAGDGYFESRDGGASWRSPEEGLRHGYLFGVAADPGDPETVVVSAAAGPGSAYVAARATTYLYRRQGPGPWGLLREGLPDARRTTITVLATHPQAPGVVYAANNRGVFRSRDGGARWTALELPWPARFQDHAVQGLVAVDP